MFHNIFNVYAKILTRTPEIKMSLEDMEYTAYSLVPPGINSSIRIDTILLNELFLLLWRCSYLKSSF